MADPHRIVRAWLESPVSGVIELNRDWARRAPPRFSLGKQCLTPDALSPAPASAAARTLGYHASGGGDVAFVLSLGAGSAVDPARDTVYLAGDFNDWQQAVGRPEWQMLPAELDGERVLRWTGNAAGFFGGEAVRFKFVTGEHQWLTPPAEAANLVRDAQGNVNRYVDAARTGAHLWRFTVSEPLSLAEAMSVDWAEGGDGAVPLVPGPFFFDLKTDLPLGAIVRGPETIFRLFAPRAQSVTLGIARETGDAEEPLYFPMARRPDADGAAGVWQIALDRSLHGWFYWYSVGGEAGSGFDPRHRVLDPYAAAAAGRDGPGIVLDAAWMGQGDRSFATPAWHDLVIVEAHVRDLAQHAPVAATDEERRGFTGLRKWVESDDFYLHRLGVNCVELQPVHEFDDASVDEYHWGYMTNSYLAPESSYALAPREASGVKELQALVAAFHRRGMAVVLDVVFNHVGVPAHLMFVDRLYYFEQDAGGALTNWSGCGNDLRARSAMARRLIIDSCTHYLEVFGVDGFRFDLAELLGVDVLREVEAALKKVKRDVILIAEPWSFRGHIAGALRDTGWASWNDGYRDFVRDYLRGNGEPERMEYFLRGSPWYFAKWPAQTINYTESHDDRTWIDMITERPGHNGFVPTSHDRRRTHLMAALLFMSHGVPMLSAGQDFMRSKHGVNNTYQRGDLNALDYRRLYRFLSTHAYFADWIAFRRGEHGRLLRQWTRPSEGFFKFVRAEGSPALAAVYNADGSQGAPRLLFAINPTTADVTIPLGAALAYPATGTPGGAAPHWDMLADHERFYLSDAHGGRRAVEPSLWMPSLSCALWICEI
jgi:pullulanase/glycogen debranching enzyme